MLKRYGDNALEESAARANELALAGDDDGAAIWRRITAAVEQSSNKIPPAGSTKWSVSDGEGPTLLASRPMAPVRRFRSFHEVDRSQRICPKPPLDVI